MLAVVVATVVFGIDEPAIGWLLGPSVALALVGLGDDVRSLPGSVRLGMQVAAALTMVLGLSRDLALGLPAAIFVLVAGFFVVGYTNAFNFMDGVNGISGLNAAVAGGWFAYVGLEHDLGAVTVLGAALMGGALGFLPWNAPRAKVFLGDVGSYGIGSLIAGLAMAVWAAGLAPLVALAPLVIYLADTAWVLLKRAKAGESLMVAHRDHAYQRLVTGGWSHIASAGWAALLAAAVVLAAAHWASSRPWAVVLIGAVVIVGYLSLPSLLAPSATRDHQEVS